MLFLLPAEQLQMPASVLFVAPTSGNLFRFLWKQVYILVSVHVEVT